VKTASITTPLISINLPAVPCACSDMCLPEESWWSGSAAQSAANALGV
jgi:hypothetical protein